MPILLPSPEHLRNHPDQIPDAVDESLKLIRNGSHLNAFVTTFDERARLSARRVRDLVVQGEQLPLAGWLIAVKDNIAIEGERLTCASGMLREFHSAYTATAVERLEDAGAVVVGKTNLDEFAMGSSSETGFFGSVRSPIDPALVAGGSSGGSAVAVAAGWVHGALGSDTGGSVRQPAAFCGVTGLKPTYGRVSRYGLVAFGSSLDQISPFAYDADGAFRLVCAMAGLDVRDSSSADHPVPSYASGLPSLTRKLRIGIPKEYIVDGVATQIADSIRKVTDHLGQNGHAVREVSLPHTRYAIPVYYIIATAEASSNLARYDGVRYGWRNEDAMSLAEVYGMTRGAGFGAEVRRRIMIGTYVLSAGYYDAYYKKAQRVRRLIRDDFSAAFKQVDVILAPTTPTTAFKLGERLTDPLEMYLSDVFTTPANLAGIPSVSTPFGADSEGKPIGIQIMGPAFSEEHILQAAKEVENLTGHQSA